MKLSETTSYRNRSRRRIVIEIQLTRLVVKYMKKMFQVPRTQRAAALDDRIKWNSLSIVNCAILKVLFCALESRLSLRLGCMEIRSHSMWLTSAAVFSAATEIVVLLQKFSAKKILWGNKSSRIRSSHCFRANQAWNIVFMTISCLIKSFQISFLSLFFYLKKHFHPEMQW